VLSTTPPVSYVLAHVAVAFAPAFASHPVTVYDAVNDSSITFFINEYAFVPASTKARIPNCSAVSRYSASDTLLAPTRRWLANIENRRALAGTCTPR
jgi:hypothetical protein